MRILIAPNAFKGSLSAMEAAEHLKAGLSQSRLQCHSQLFPIADGGDGTADLLVEHLQGRRVIIETLDGLGRPVQGHYGLIEQGRTAVIDLATASGIRLIKPADTNPLLATTEGSGIVIQAALSTGVKKIILGLGGSASIDGGAGILHALGAKFLDENGNVLQPVPQQLQFLHRLDLSELDSRLSATQLIVLCDVQNPLLGPSGAAPIFGPQKGALAEQIMFFSDLLNKLETVYRQASGITTAHLPHAGAAGGVAAGMHSCLGASLVNGADFFLEYTGFPQALQQADLLLTAEGKLDEQTLQGKAPYWAAKLAKSAAVPVIAFAGSVPLINPTAFSEFFDVLLPINHRELSLSEAIEHTPENLIRAATALGNMLAIGRSASL